MRRSDWVELPADPYRGGRMRGRMCAVILRKRIAKTRRVWNKRKFPLAVIEARIRDFSAIVRKVAPHWLEEVSGLADGARVAKNDILMLNCLPPGFYPAQAPGMHCTTFVEVGRRQNRLFKIRDERNHMQAFYVQHMPNGNYFQVGHDIGNIGVAHFLNRYGVGGANNTGSHTAYVPDDPLLNDCHILRYFAEHAKSMDDLPRLFERLIKKRMAGGAGPGRGAIYSAVDARRGLILETQSSDYAAEFVDYGVKALSNHYLSKKASAWQSKEPNRNTLARLTRMRELLAKHEGELSCEDVFAVSRDRKNVPNSLCNDDSRHFWMTISAQLHVIERSDPERSVNYMCCGNTRHAVYVPVLLEWRDSFAPLLDGRYYRAADSLYRRYGARNVFARHQKSFEARCLDHAGERRNLEQAYALLRQTWRAHQPRNRVMKTRL